MRVPISWLRDYVDIGLSPEALAERLTMAGLEVASIEYAGAEWTDVVVGRLLDVAPHPNADTLTVTKVDAGAPEPLEIVCGATNIEPGQLVPVALPGATLPGGRRIGRSRIRGVDSHGMLCSAQELGVGADADGILILGTANEHPIGGALRAVLGEAVLDVDVKPNRGDALSMVGIAREVAAITGAAVRIPLPRVVETDVAAVDHVSVRIEEPELCPRFTARYFDGVRNGRSPDWMQRRLVAAGMRPISAVVDVTNYVMHELGQPMHAYDADTVPGGRLEVRRARDGEELVTIDHERRTLDPSMLVIADERRAIGLAGVMGGADTEVTDATSRVILESAIFHGPTIRSAARRLGLRSEASSRHEKGIAWEVPTLAADRAAELLRDVAAARAARGIVDNDPRPRPPHRIDVRPERVSRLLGLSLDAEAISRLLAPLGLHVHAAPDPGAVRVTVPSHRLDVAVEADVAEELARAHGYDHFVGRLPSAPLPAFRADPSGARHTVRRVLAGLGLDEVVTHALIDAADLRSSGYDADARSLVRVANPVSEEHSILRPVIYPSLLRALQANVRQRRAAAWLFEVGKVYWAGEGDPTPRERRVETAGTGRYEDWEVGIILGGTAVDRSWQSTSREADVDDLKGVVDALHRAVGAPAPAFRQEDGQDRHPHLHPGRAARILDAEGVDYGSLGEVDPRVCAAWDLPGRPVIAAIALGRLLALVSTAARAVGLPAAQPVDRDLAVVVAEEMPAGELLATVRRAAGPMLVELRLFDIYRGDQIGPGRVSYAFALRFQPTAPDGEPAVDRAMAKIRRAVQHRHQAEVRG